MNINTISSSKPPNYSYEFYTIHTSSNIGGNTPNGSSYTTFLSKPLKDVVQVSILLAQFVITSTPTGARPCFLTVDELPAEFNVLSGEVSGNTISTTSNFQNPIAVFKLNDEPSRDVQLYRQGDYSTQTQFVNPIRKLDRLTCKLWDSNTNDLLVLNSSNKNVHISFRFTCLRSNLNPNKKMK